MLNYQYLFFLGKFNNIKNNAMQHPIRYATYLALGTAVISGAANFLNKIAVTVIADPVLFTTLKNVMVAVFLTGIVLVFKKWPEISSLTKKQFFKLLAIGVIGGSLPFALFFTGLSKTSALSAGLIHKTLFIWVMLIAVPLLKEKISAPQLAGIAAIFAANLLVGGFTGFKYNIGELLILAATILWAMENIIAKIALRELSSITVGAARMTIGSTLLLVFIFLRGDSLSSFAALNAAQWGWTLLTSFLLFGYVLTWYTALKYAPATYVATLLVPATLLTNILSAIFVTRAFSVQQFISAVLFAAGAFLVIFFVKKSGEETAKKQTGLETATP